MQAKTKQKISLNCWKKPSDIPQTTTNKQAAVFSVFMFFMCMHEVHILHLYHLLAKINNNKTPLCHMALSYTNRYTA